MQEKSVLVLSVCLIMAAQIEWGNTGGKISAFLWNLLLKVLENRVDMTAVGLL